MNELKKQMTFPSVYGVRKKCNKIKIKNLKTVK